MFEIAVPAPGMEKPQDTTLMGLMESQRNLIEECYKMASDIRSFLKYSGTEPVPTNNGTAPMDFISDLQNNNGNLAEIMDVLHYIRAMIGRA